MADYIAYLGPAGTFCEDAARRYSDQKDLQLQPCRSIREVFQMIEQGKVKFGVVPIENSYEGAVNQTLDLLTADDNILLVGEIIIEVRQNLLTRKGLTRQEITSVLSHSQALAQCQEYLTAYLSEVELLEVSSTAAAARRVAESDQPWAAIGNTAAAQAYDLEILLSDIQDQSNNATRFVVLGQEQAVCTDNCKTSLLISILDRPGALFEVLREFYIRDINLCKIESRPARTRMGDYLFFIDIEGYREQARVREVLSALQGVAAEVRVLGSYPTAK
jgi:prephenate dehydratase